MPMIHRERQYIPYRFDIDRIQRRYRVKMNLSVYFISFRQQAMEIGEDVLHTSLHQHPG